MAVGQLANVGIGPHPTAQELDVLIGKAGAGFGPRHAGLPHGHGLGDIQNIFDSRSRHILNTQQALQLAVIGRFYERIGDHAVNIAERVTYLVTGEMPEHAGAMRAKARREAAEAQD